MGPDEAGHSGHAARPGEGAPRPLVPIAETLAAVADLDDGAALQPLLAELTRLGQRVQAVAPSCVGMSVAVVARGVTFTLAATSAGARLVDAVQFLDDGPCVRAVRDATPIRTAAGDEAAAVLREEGWSRFARASAVEGIRSSLSLPVVEADRVVGGVNLYGAEPDTFTGRVEEIAEAVGAWAGGAVADADLSFSTRDVARHAPALLRDDRTVQTAVGVLSAVEDISVARARRRLHEASVRAGVPLERLAETVLALYGLPED